MVTIHLKLLSNAILSGDPGVKNRCSDPSVRCRRRVEPKFPSSCVFRNYHLQYLLMFIYSLLCDIFMVVPGIADAGPVVEAGWSRSWQTAHEPPGTNVAIHRTTVGRV